MKHPDFNEWLKTPDGISCNDYNSLTGEEYLKNRLFWAFDAGRNCVWEQYLEQKQRIAQIEEALKMITKGAEMASHEFDDPNDATEAFSYLNICIEKAKSLLK